ncbi:MAG: molybdate ABC transporter permease subunit [Myxococcales bacterium]|nr:molybdate ABC transporter permease subunit [Myxococcales bacterium]
MTTTPWDAIALSLQVATACTLLGAPPAVALGWWLARREHPAKALVTALVFAPMVLPPVVTGLLLLALLGKHGPLGAVLDRLGLAVAFTPAAPVLAALVVGLPLFVMSARAAFAAVDPAYDELSASLGDRPRRTWWRVSLPLALPGLAGGAVLMFARSLGEFGATIVLAGNTDATRTIAIAIYALLDRPASGPDVRVLAWSSVAISLFALAGYEWLARWQRRRLDLPR